MRDGGVMDVVCLCLRHTADVRRLLPLGQHTRLMRRYFIRGARLHLCGGSLYIMIAFVGEGYPHREWDGGRQTIGKDADAGKGPYDVTREARGMTRGPCL